MFLGRSCTYCIYFGFNNFLHLLFKEAVFGMLQGSSSISAEFSGADLPEIFASLEASGLTEMSQNALESGQRISDLDIEVEIDQEGGGNQLLATLKLALNL